MRRLISGAPTGKRKIQTSNIGDCHSRARRVPRGVEFHFELFASRVSSRQSGGLRPIATLRYIRRIRSISRHHDADTRSSSTHASRRLSSYPVATTALITAAWNDAPFFTPLLHDDDARLALSLPCGIGVVRVVRVPSPPPRGNKRATTVLCPIRGPRERERVRASARCRFV